MKSLVFGSRRSANAGRDAVGPREAALAPALAHGSWRVPGKFNFTRDVVEVLAEDARRQALTYLGDDGVIEPRTFLQLAQGAARWATRLRERGIGPGDRVLVLEATTPDWVEVLLAGIKVGAVTVSCGPGLAATAVEIRIAASGAKLVVATRASEPEVEQSSAPADVLYVDDVRRQAPRSVTSAPTHDTSARDPAFIVSTSGRTNGPRPVLHAHGSTFAARVHAEHWLDAGLGDVVWCTSPSDSAQALWSTLLGPWARGAEVVLHQGGVLDAVERLELVRRAGVTVLCQTPAEYRALAESGLLQRFRGARPRRLVSTGERLDEDLIELYEEEWGLTIHDGYGQAETGVVAGHDVATGFRAGSIGRALPGYEVAVIDENGDELPPGVEGDVALHGRPPSLFVGYWNAPDETDAAFRGNWYLTGDKAVRDDDGFLWLRERADTVLVEEEEELFRASETAAEPATEPEAPILAVAVSAAPAGPAVESREPAAAFPAPLVVPRDDGPVPEEPMRQAAPLWTRVAVTIWVLLVGILIGGAAVPHAQDKPRIVPRSEDAPNAICVPPSPRG